MLFPVDVLRTVTQSHFDVASNPVIAVVALRKVRGAFVLLPVMEKGPESALPAADSSKLTDRAEASPTLDVTGSANTPAGQPSAAISIGSAKLSFRWTATVILVALPGVRSNRSAARFRAKSGCGSSTLRR